MLRLIKYLKPYWLLVVLSIGLLYAQAMADLALPNYMSDIVNVGIQQGGVESAVPEVIRKSEMDRVLLFLSQEEADTVLANYTLVDESYSDYDQLLKDYPAIETETFESYINWDRIRMKALTMESGPCTKPIR